MTIHNAVLRSLIPLIVLMDNNSNDDDEDYDDIVLFTYIDSNNSVTQKVKVV